MPNKKISELTAASTISGGELIPIVRNGVNMTTTPKQLSIHNLNYNNWTKLPAIYKLIVGGTGTVVIDSKTKDGAISLAVQTYTINGNEEIYDFFENAYEVRATLTGTAFVEIV